jgi:hypothetical protein
VQALVRPLAEHDALFELTMDTHRIDSAESFQRLLVDPATPRETIVSARADAQVWWEVLERYPQSAVWVAANRALPQEIVAHLAMSHVVQVRAAVASAAEIGEAVMMRLAHDPSELIRVRLVCNARLTRDVLIAMAGDACKVVAAHAQARLMHDARGAALPDAYLGGITARDVLH